MSTLCELWKDVSSGENEDSSEVTPNGQDIIPVSIEREERDKQCIKEDRKTSVSSTSQKICRVCGDKALSYNFGALACESCKAFFRRSAGKEEHFHCPFMKECNIVVQTRKYCQLCRLMKCYQVGMSMQSIVMKERKSTKRSLPLETPEIKPKRIRLDKNQREKRSSVLLDIPGNEDRKENGVSNVASACSTAQGPEIVLLEPSAARMPPQTHIGSGSDADTKSLDDEEVVVKIFLPKSEMKDCMNDNQLTKLHQEPSIKQEVQESPCGFTRQRANTIDMAIPRTHHRSFELPIASHSQNPIEATCKNTVIKTGPEWSGIGASTAHTSYNPTNHSVCQLSPPLEAEMKCIKFEELLMANKVWNMKPSKARPLRGATIDDFTMEDYGDLLYHLFGTTIKQHSRLMAFKTLPCGDKYSMIKRAVYELSILRAVSKYNAGNGMLDIQYPGQHCVSLEAIKRVREPVHAKINELINAFPEKWRANEPLMLILSAVAFFNPDYVQVQSKATVYEERRIFLQLLMDYLENSYGVNEARSAYQYLITCVNSLSAWTKKNWQGVVFDMDPRSFDLLLLDFTNFE